MVYIKLIQNFPFSTLDRRKFNSQHTQSQVPIIHYLTMLV